MKRIFLSIAMLIFISTPITHIAAQESLSTIVLQIGSKEALINGDNYLMDTMPKVDKGTTYVPLRFISDSLGGQTSWSKQNQSVSITRGNDQIRLKIGSNIASVNGVNTRMNARPIMDNDRILVPLRFVGNSFNLAVDYNPNTKQIKLYEAVLPIAKFEFSKDSYMAGEKVNVIEQSYSPNGEKIVERLWEVNRNSKNQSNDLSKIFSKPNEGTYNIRLKVRNSNNMWSDWEEKTIVIDPHPKPIILELSSVKDTWDQGEEIRLSYTKQIRDWEKIVEERWTYKKKGKDKVFNGKPRALFEQGEYIITLEIKDSYGAWSDPKEIEIQVSDKQLTTELDFKLNNLIPGENIDNFSKYNFQNYDIVEDFNILTGNINLLFSNSPETIRQKGILYSDKVSGLTRLVYHHKNGIPNSSNNMRLVVIAQNNSGQNVTIKKLKSSNMGPSKDILHLGQSVTYNYLNSNDNSSIVIPPNSRRFLYDTQNRNWPDNESLSGVMEFDTSSTVSITIAAVSRDFKIDSLDKVPVLNRDGIHTRGTFQNANKYYDLYLQTDRPSKISLGQNDGQMDSWLVGYDALTKDTVYNKGNYGVLYELNVNTKEKTGVILNARGTSFKGAFKWKDDQTYNAPNRGILIGSNQATVVGVVNGDINRQVIYSLSNGSSAPVLFNFIPERFWLDYEISKTEED